MSYEVEVEPTTGASTNPLGITFGSTATIEFDYVPEKLLNKDVSGVELTMVDTTGIHLSKGSFRAVIPWSSIVTLIY